jgi:hypothetical protein
MSIKLSAVRDDANDAHLKTARASEGIVYRLGYRFLIILILSILSWVALIAIVMALLEALCPVLRLVTQKQEVCEAFSGLLGSF